MAIDRILLSALTCIVFGCGTRLSEQIPLPDEVTAFTDEVAAFTDEVTANDSEPTGSMRIGFNEVANFPSARGQDFVFDEKRVKNQLALAKELGAGVLRVHTGPDPSFAMSKLEEDNWDFTQRDQHIAVIQEAGFEVVLMIGPWPGNRTESFTDEYLPSKLEYQAYVRKVVERYDGDGIDDADGLLRPIFAWEVDNEPDLHYKASKKNAQKSGQSTERKTGKAAQSSSSQRSGQRGKAGKRNPPPRGKASTRYPRGPKGAAGPGSQRNSADENAEDLFQTPEEYASVFEWTKEAVHHADAKAKVIPAGIISMTETLGQTYLSDVVSNLAPHMRPDVANIHVYLERYGENQLYTAIENAQTALPGARIWVTETSAPSGAVGSDHAVGQRGQAALVARVIFGALASGADLVLWHSLADPPIVYDDENNVMAESNSLYVGRDTDIIKGPNGYNVFDNLHPKLSASTFAKVASILQETEEDGVSFSSQSTKTLRVVQLQFLDGSVGFIAWSNDPSRQQQTLSLELPAKHQSAWESISLVADGEDLTDKLVTTLPSKKLKNKGGVVNLRVTREPLLIRPKTSSRD